MIRRGLVVLAIGVLVVAFGFTALLLFGVIGVRSEWPGGLRSDYPARDGDPRLTGIARTALPVIDAIERHRIGCGEVPSSLAAVGLDESTGWIYERTTSTSYRLARKLGWDTALHYEWTPDGSAWYFLPGDGNRPDVRIDLDP